MLVKKIAIIGTGRIGTRLAEQLVVDRVSNQILLWNRTSLRLEGTILSLNVWARILQLNSTFSILDWENLNSVDLVVIAIKEKYDPREIIVTEPPPPWLPQNLRYVGLIKDLPLLRAVCEKLGEYNGKVVVLTNPVDIMASLVSKWLPNADVFGLGATLDSARLSYLLYNKFSLNVSPYDILLGGEHGSQMVPLKSIWHFNNNINSVTYKEVQNLIPEVKEIGFQIVRCLGYTLQDCAVVFSNDIAWLLAHRQEHKISVFSIWDESACVGLPVIHSEESNMIVKYEEISRAEKQNILNIKKKLATLLELIKKNSFRPTKSL